MPTFQDAFISYARADSKAFVITLKERLQSKGIGQIWLDQDDIPAATDWQQRIDEAIGRAHHFIYVISPSAMASPYCKLELTLARQYGKRIIPLLHGAGGDSKAWAIADPEGCTAVRQLNWIWCRDGLDDPEQFVERLSRTLHYCDETTGAAQAHVQTYVHQHTALLTQALTWERHHRQTRYLLVGTDRQAAETWLQTRFADGEPLPCTPSDLHCEFITESTKNASNLMTQVFLCHSDQDQAPAEQLRRSLLRQGITVWNYRTDIQTSQDYNSAIGQGIEEADNIVFVLSPQSAQSPYCQKELAQALALNKRVIPVLAAAVEPDLVPEGLRNLQHIDLTDNIQASDYLADESQLLKQINTDAAYHTEHKTWLVQALKWQRQQQNPTLLLRGYNLRQAETWLKVARTHRYPPTELHDQFIAESLRQPPDSSLDVFISYSRVDSDFARRLNDALQTQGKRTWFDQESIATGSDFQQEIYRGIESSDVFVFVLSPEAVTSPFCADEVEYAQGLNKRMVTVLHRAIDVADLHPVLGKLQWLDFREHDGDFQANFAGLLRTLDTDREHLETHTRLLVRSGEWDRRGRDESLLLRGQDLQTAETWLATNAKVEPQPTGLQQEYIRAARARQEAQHAAEKKLRRGALIGAMATAVGIVVAVGSGWFAVAAKKEQHLAQTGTRLEQAGTAALRRLEFDQIGALLRTIKAGRELETAVAEAGSSVKAVTEYPAASPIFTLQQLKTSLAKSLLAHKGLVYSATFSPEGDRVVTTANDGTARVWDLKAGVSTPLEGHREGINSATFSPDGDRIVTASKDSTARVWDLKTGASTLLEGHTDIVNSAAFSPEGDRVVTAANDGTARVWDLKTGASTPLEGHTGQVNSASFNPKGDRVVTASGDGTARVWDLKTEASALLEGHTSTVRSATFRPEGDRVVTASSDGTARVWDLKTGASTPLEGHTVVVRSATFSPEGDRVVTASWDRTARVWDLKTGAFTLLEGHTEGINSATFSPKGDRVVTVSEDDTAWVWDLKTGASTPLEGHTDRVFKAAFSPEGDRIVTVSEDGTARVWDSKTGASAPLEGHTEGIKSATFSPKGDRVVTASEDGTVRVWDFKTGTSTPLAVYTWGITSATFSLDGYRVVVTALIGDNARVWDLKTGASTFLEGHTEGINSATFSPEGDRVVTASEDGTARVWTLQTGESAPLEGHQDWVNNASFSPDGQQVFTESADGTARMWDLQGRQLAIYEGYPATLSPDGQRVATVVDGRVQVYDIETLPELLAWGCQWLHNYLEYGQATDADRAICNLPPRDSDPAGPFESSFGRTLGLVQVTWPQRG